MRAKSGDIPGAIADLNVIRKRVGAKEYTPDENLEETIALERDKDPLSPRRERRGFILPDLL